VPVVIVTGSTDGLGREVALRVAATGAHVVVHGRNRERGAEVVREIEAAGGSARFYAADFASVAQVKELAATLVRDYPRIDVLVNNAGIWDRASRTPQLSADGHEMHFAVNYLSGFVLTRLLLPRLLEAPEPRIINVASGSQTALQFDDLMMTRGYNDSRAYSQSKLAQIIFTFDLAAELAGRRILVATLHPATLMDTSLVLEAGMAPRSTVAEGAAAVMNLVTAPNLASGQYFNGTQPARANAQAYDAQARAELRRVSFELAGLPNPAP
jgi:NAD(P)-dependent dehydrogenase (short-subunit alcohol dehydrogenase family)